MLDSVVPSTAPLAMVSRASTTLYVYAWDWSSNAIGRHSVGSAGLGSWSPPSALMWFRLLDRLVKEHSQHVIWRRLLGGRCRYCYY